MGFFKRLFGICDTEPPADAGCFRFADGEGRLRALEVEERDGSISIAVG